MIYTQLDDVSVEGESEGSFVDPSKGAGVPYMPIDLGDMPFGWAWLKAIGAGVRNFKWRMGENVLVELTTPSLADQEMFKLEWRSTCRVSGDAATIFGNMMLTAPSGIEARSGSISPINLGPCQKFDLAGSNDSGGASVTCTQLSMGISSPT